MKNNNEETNGKANGSENLFSPKISINIPVSASKDKILEVLSLLDVDVPLPQIDSVHQINLQMEVN